jgi:hypothetical protein
VSKNVFCFTANKAQKIGMAEKSRFTPLSEPLVRAASQNTSMKVEMVGYYSRRWQKNKICESSCNLTPILFSGLNYKLN